MAELEVHEFVQGDGFLSRFSANMQERRHLAVQSELGTDGADVVEVDDSRDASDQIEDFKPDFGGEIGEGVEYLRPVLFCNMKVLGVFR